MPNIFERAQRAWNVLTGKDSRGNVYYNPGSSYRQDKRWRLPGDTRTIIGPIVNRIAVDAAGITIKHVLLDEEDRFSADADSELNEVLNTEANIDQAGRAFLQDIYESVLDEGVVAVVPIDCEVSETVYAVENRFEVTKAQVRTARVGQIKQWFPKEIDVEVYNDKTGNRETIRVPKSLCLIIENPFQRIMNEPNSTLQRLKRKLLLLDQFDEQSVSGKLDLIIQLPYTVRTEKRKEQAEARKRDIEVQLAGSKYGVAYTDASEKIIQLNRSLENTLTPQIQDLKKQVYDELGVSPEILNSTATEQQQLEYMTNIIEPLVSTVVNEIRRKWLTKNARSRKHSVMYFRDPFKIVPISQIADIGDKLTRNEILSSNEIRGKIGFKPSNQPGADELRNKNLNISDTQLQNPEQYERYEAEMDRYNQPQGDTMYEEQPHE